MMTDTSPEAKSRPYTEIYDIVYEVKENPYGAHSAIHWQATRIAELETELANAVAEAHDAGVERERWKARAETAEAEVARLQKVVCRADKFFEAFKDRIGGRGTMSYLEQDLLADYDHDRAAIQEKPHK